MFLWLLLWRWNLWKLCVVGLKCWFYDSMFLSSSPHQIANLAGFVVGLSGIRTFCSKLLVQESEKTPRLYNCHQHKLTPQFRLCNTRHNSQVMNSGPSVQNWIPNFQLPRCMSTKPNHFWGVLSGADVGLCLCIFFSFYVGTKVGILDSTCHTHMRFLEGLVWRALPSCGCAFLDPLGASLS